MEGKPEDFPRSLLQKEAKNGHTNSHLLPVTDYLGEGCLGGWPDSHMAIPWKFLQPNPVSL